MATDDTNVERQRRFRERRAAASLVLIRTYVPQRVADRARRLAEREGCSHSEIATRSYSLGLKQLAAQKTTGAAVKNADLAALAESLEGLKVVKNQRLRRALRPLAAALQPFITALPMDPKAKVIRRIEVALKALKPSSTKHNNQ